MAWFLIWRFLANAHQRQIKDRKKICLHKDGVVLTAPDVKKLIQGKYFFEKNANLSTRQINQLYSSSSLTNVRHAMTNRRSYQQTHFPTHICTFLILSNHILRFLLDVVGMAIVRESEEFTGYSITIADIFAYCKMGCPYLIHYA